MPALAKLPPAQGIAAMQSINLGSRLRMVASASYLLGTFLVTRAGNIPLNDALARVAPETAAAAELWSRYVADWTRCNTVRSQAALGAAGLRTLALVHGARGTAG